jgi:Ser/Thr protein kinase RdoA (MazF antagonist)
MRQRRRSAPAATVGLWWVRTAHDAAFLKVVAHGEGHPRWPSAREPEDPWYWRREPLAYESGLLGRLGGGLRAPRLRGAFERADGSVALWLEDVSEPDGWTPGRLGEVAHRVGVAQAALAADPPRADWLSRGWLRSYLRLRSELVAAGGAEARALAGGGEAVLARLETMPQTFCHNDLHPGNVLGPDATAIVDWAYCGLAAVGLDAGVLAADALFDGFVPAADAARAADSVWEGYGDGLADGGLGAARAEARWAFLAGTALRLSWVPGFLRVTELERETRERYAALVPVLGAWAEAARQLPSAP